MVDENGLPIRIILTAGQTHDQKAVPELLSELTPGCDVVADKGYDADAVLEFIHQAGARAHIPSLSRRILRRSLHPETYRKRNLVERFFNKLKHFRRITYSCKHSESLQDRGLKILEQNLFAGVAITATDDKSHVPHVCGT